MMMRRYALFAVVGLAFCLILTSCGTIGADQASPTATPESNQSTSSAGTSASPETLAVSSPEEATSQAADDCWPADAKRTEAERDPGMAMQWNQPPEMKIDPTKKYLATMNTSGGSFVVELLPEDAPLAANNFYCLAEAGYYDNTPFHRIIEGFVIQGGDPTGTGTGGPGYKFNDEPVTRKYIPGSLAMANAGPNTNGSQFFVVLDDLTGKLPPNYTNFGQVVEGMDVVDALGKTPTKSNARGEKSVPVEPVTLLSVKVQEIEN